MDMIKRFVRYYKPHKRLFMLDTACSLMVAICDLFYPMIAKNITNVPAIVLFVILFIVISYRTISDSYLVLSFVTGLCCSAL